VRVGFLSTRLAGTDGVSLESAKVVALLVRMGHDVAYCAGELDAGGPGGLQIAEMHFRHPEIEAIQADVFRCKDTQMLRSRIAASVKRLRASIREFVQEYRLDLLVAQNACAIPMNIPLGIALSEEVAEAEIRCVGHHHDFAWERERFTPCAVQDLIDMHFPPKGRSIRHAVISSIARRELLRRRGIESIVLPNVMDFASGPPARASRSEELRTALGFGDDDIVLLQPTRVVPRKGVEHAIELARRLVSACHPRSVHLLISHPSGDEGPEYANWLQKEAATSGVDLVLAADRFVAVRESEDSAGFDLRDAYELADFVTFPSHIEGFGNALLEAVFYRKPLLVNRFPVYVADIAPCRFDFVEIDRAIDQETADSVARLLDDAELSARTTTRNYAIATEHFSYEVAERRLAQLIDRWA